MANLDCLLVFSFGNFLAPILVATHKFNNLDLEDDKRFEDEDCESD